MMGDIRLTISDCKRSEGCPPSRNRKSQIANHKSPRPASGFTLLECLTALIILSIGLASVFALFAAGLRTHKRGVDQTTAGTFAQKVLAELQARLTDDYLTTIAGRGPTGKRKIELKDQADVAFPGPYKYDATIEAFDTRRDAYAVTLKVKWLEGGQEQSAVFQTVLLRKLER